MSVTGAFSETFLFNESMPFQHTSEFCVSEICFYGTWKLIGSDDIEYEIAKTPDIIKRNKALNLYSIKKELIELNDDIEKRASEVQKHKLKPMDSLHFASAEYRNVDVLLTVDKDFIKYSKDINPPLKVENPINWFIKEIEND
jgi:predicted nucleic acid-binding protein